MDGGTNTVETLHFEAQVVKNFQSLAKRNFHADEAAALALKFASGAVPRPLDPKAIVLDAQGGADLRIVLNHLASMFSTPETLAASFARKRSAAVRCVDTEKHHLLHVPTTRQVGKGNVTIDFEALDAVYHSFTDSPPMVATLLSAAAGLVAHLATDAIEDPSGSTAVTAALVLLENPLLEEPDHHCTLLHKLQQCVSTYLVQEQRIDLPLEHVVRLISQLYRANEEGGMLSFTDFYNDRVNHESFDWQDDHMRWKLPSPGTFSFCTYPFMIDPACKQRVLQLQNRQEQEGELQGAILQYLLSPEGHSKTPFLVLKVKRGPTLIADTLDQIQQRAARDELKRPLKVHFVGEEGIDEGGVQKEFFQLIFRGMFDQNYGMFVLHETTRQYWFRSSRIPLDMEFQLLGILLGLAIYNNHILELSFPMLVYRKLMGHKPTFEDLKEVAPEIHSSLGKLLEYEDASQLGLYFQVDTEGEFGEERRQVDLIQGGGDILVTNANRQEYVKLYCVHLLERSVHRQFTAFKRGFLKMCGGPALALFRPEELELLVCGSQRLDFNELQSATLYHGGYHRSHEVVRWFWEVAEEMPMEQKKRLLFFVTGSDRVPIKGLANLAPQFTIARNGPASHRLPTAHTCFNQLMLPHYKNKQMLRERLLTAIENAEGFGLK